LCNVRRAMIRVCPDTRCEVVCRHRFEWVRSGQLPFLSGEGGWLSCPRHGMAWGRTGASVRCLVSCCGGRLGVMLETPPLHVSLARARSGSVLWFPGYRRKFQSKWLRAKGFWARALRQKRPCPGACILAHSGRPPAPGAANRGIPYNCRICPGKPQCGAPLAIYKMAILLTWQQCVPGGERAAPPPLVPGPPMVLCVP
jgi:hypothetical protein